MPAALRLTRVHPDESVYATAAIERFASSSDWSEEEIEQSTTALRSAVMTLLRGEDAWSMSITSILDLLDAVLSGASTWLTTEEISIVDSAALESVNTILRNTTDYNEVFLLANFGPTVELLRKPWREQTRQLIKASTCCKRNDQLTGPVGPRSFDACRTGRHRRE